MSTTTFPSISRVFSNQLCLSVDLPLLGQATFPTIGKIGPQVSGMTVNGSITPNIRQLWNFPQLS